MSKFIGMFAMENGQMCDLYVLISVEQAADVQPTGTRLYTVATRIDAQGAVQRLKAGLTGCKIQSVHCLDMVLTLDKCAWPMDQTGKYDLSYFRLSPMDPDQVLPDGQYSFEAVNYH